MHNAENRLTSERRQVSKRRQAKVWVSLDEICSGAPFQIGDIIKEEENMDSLFYTARVILAGNNGQVILKPAHTGGGGLQVCTSDAPDPIWLYRDCTRPSGLYIIPENPAALKALVLRAEELGVRWGVEDSMLCVGDHFDLEGTVDYESDGWGTIRRESDTVSLDGVIICLKTPP